jgi:subtilase family serine protease
MNTRQLFCLTPSSASPDDRFVKALKAAAVAALLCASLTTVLAQEPEVGIPSHERAPLVSKPTMVPGMLVVPASSQVKAEDRGLRAHTNVRFIIPATTSPMEAPPYGGYSYETPASLACDYQLVTHTPGCNPNSTITVPSGGGQTIAIVDAYDDPEAPADLAYFSDQFGLPFSPSKFQVIYATPTGYAPDIDYSGGWELEESLDIEYAHAMAPNAKLYLVEAYSSSYSDLLFAVQVANNLVVCGKTEINYTSGVVGTCPSGSTGKGEVSMSWGGGEFSSETTYDTYFTTPNVLYFASAGDSPGAIYPSTSPNVISCGGTSIARSLVNGNFMYEIAWSDAGGGVSTVEPIPSYQSAQSTVLSKAGTHRATPDISSDANPNTGLWVYDTFPQDGDYYSTWWIVGGTSASAPTLAGIVNAAEANSGVWAASTSAELTKVYSLLATANATTYAADFNDITYGACNYYSGSISGTGYDLCTGVGSPRTLTGK